MSQPLPYDEIKLDNIVKLEEILDTPDEIYIDFFIEVDLKNPHKTK